MEEVTSNPTDNRFNQFCAGAFDYSGDAPCAYNMVYALSQTLDFLKQNISSSDRDWIWRNVHQMEWPNTPWSRTPLKLLFHREVPRAGNSNTPNVAKFSILRSTKEGVFKSVHSANFKHIVDLSTEREGLYSVDTGNDGNIFSGHYFTMNKDHINGRLQTMKIGQELQNIKTNTLIIHPASEPEKIE